MSAMRVLIVEDEVKMASLIRRGLRDDGMAADVAIKGQDALWMAGSTEYEAIVLDVMLLGMDGFQVCRRLRRPGAVLDRFQLLEHAWDYEYENRSNVVDVYVRYLREKIDRPFGVESIETVRGAGYRMRADGGREET
jgi:DNA-binding response OmpR family regulator